MVILMIFTKDFNQMRSRPSVLGLLAALSSGHALAQTAPPTEAPAQTRAIQLDEINVRGAGGPRGELQPLGPVPPAAQLPHARTQSVTVIDRAEIERSNPAGTLELLQEVPGVSINRAGGINGTVFLRGLNTNDFRVPMYIDGDRARGRNTLQLMLLSPNEIERIEVIRGPASSMYGSDALGGLLNFVTRRPAGDPFAPSFRFTGGDSFLMYGTNGNQVQGGLGIEGAGAGFDARISINGRQADDYRSGQGRVGNSDYKTGSASIVLGYSPTTNQRAEFALRATSVTDGRAGTQPAYPLSTQREATLQLYSGRLGYTGTFDNSIFRTIDASIYRNEFFTKLTNSNAATARQITDSNSYVIGPTVWGGRIAGMIPWASTRTTIGADFITENRPGSEASSLVTRTNAAGQVISMTSSARRKSGPDAQQFNIGSFVNSEWDVSRTVMLNAAGRFDWVVSDPAQSPLASPNLLPAFRAAQSTSATATTGSVGISYRPTPIIELVGNVGTSFRYPVTSELFSQGLSGSTYTIPNPDLRPERGVNVEGGLRLHFPRATIRATAFRSQFENFLLNVPTTYMGFAATQRQNVGDVEMTGVEADWRWQIHDALNFFGNVTALRATNTTTHTAVPYIAPFGGRAGLQYVLADRGVALTGAVDWAAGKSRVDSTQEFKTAAYGILNLSAEMRLDRLVSPVVGNTTLTVTASNLLDASYRSAATAANVAFRESTTNPLLEPGRSFTVALRNRF